MIIARPTVAEERWLELADRYPAAHSAVENSGNGGGWKSSTLAGRCLGFVLGLVGAAMLAGVLSQVPSPWLIGGVLLVLGAEWMVAQRRVLRSGVEEAMYLCGAVAIAVQWIIWSPGGGAAWVGASMIATAVLLAGWRLLNPLLTTLAAMGYTLAIAFGDGNLFGGGMNTREAGLVCAVLAVVALIAGGHRYQRPSHDRMLDGLVVAMPWLGYCWLVQYHVDGISVTHWMSLVFALGFLVANLAVGLFRRRHAPLIGALGNIVCAGYSLHHLLPFPTHWQLMAGGMVLLTISILLDRLLRGRSRGLTTMAMEDSGALDLLQVHGAALLSPAPGSPSSPGFEGQGGEFGGGGASGRF